MKSPQGRAREKVRPERQGGNCNTHPVSRHPEPRDFHMRAKIWINRDLQAIWDKAVSVGKERESLRPEDYWTCHYMATSPVSHVNRVCKPRCYRGDRGTAGPLAHWPLQNPRLHASPHNCRVVHHCYCTCPQLSSSSLWWNIRPPTHGWDE